ncbi:MAG: exodeoxyribonuclease VII small subunit [Ignavibacteriales bacterium]|nr:exodeoxyribonuclease VII small subunit [Ignavibacteriales bacterium]
MTGRERPREADLRPCRTRHPWTSTSRTSKAPSPNSRPSSSKLEEGDLALEQSLELYERGVRLSRYCHARLEEAERRIEVLAEGGEITPAPASLAAVGEDDGAAPTPSSEEGPEA